MAAAALSSGKEETPGLCVGTCAHVSQIFSCIELDFPDSEVFVQNSKRRACLISCKKAFKNVCL